MLRRCRLLLHVVGVSPAARAATPRRTLEQINHEAGRVQCRAGGPSARSCWATKCDIAKPRAGRGSSKRYVEAKGLTFLPISAATRRGVDNLPALVYNRLKDLPPVKGSMRPSTSAPTRTPSRPARSRWSAPATTSSPSMPRGWSVSSPVRTSGTTRACNISRRSWVIPVFWTSWSPRALREEDTIKIGEYEFDYLY